MCAKDHGFNEFTCLHSSSSRGTMSCSMPCAPSMCLKPRCCDLFVLLQVQCYPNCWFHKWHFEMFVTKPTEYSRDDDTLILSYAAMLWPHQFHARIMMLAKVSKLHKTLWKQGNEWCDVTACAGLKYHIVVVCASTFSENCWEIRWAAIQAGWILRHLCRVIALGDLPRLCAGLTRLSYWPIELP